MIFPKDIFSATFFASFPGGRFLRGSNFLVAKHFAGFCTKNPPLSAEKPRGKQPPARVWKAPSGHNTGIKVTNSLTNELDWLIFRDPHEVSWYICGPTVYDHAHLGHARTYVSFDIIRRILTLYFRYNIVQAMGITDIDEKIIKKAALEGVDIKNMTKVYRREFFLDMDQLGVDMPTIVCSVSENIGDMISLTESLISKGLAYVTNGSVYFQTRSIGEKYGRLSPLSVARKEATVLSDETGVKSEKQTPMDFALWKNVKNSDIFWESPWGYGRPGWHTECASMACSVFGSQLDLHTGGSDLKFPHHENEIAQCEGHFGVDQWANYFIHTGQLFIEGKQMSKRLKNFTSVKEMLKTHSSSSFRMFCLMHRYRQPVEYNEERMKLAIQMQHKFAEFFLNIHSYVRLVMTKKLFFSRKWTLREFDLHEKFTNVKKDIDRALRTDFDTPQVLRLLTSLCNSANSHMSQSYSSSASPHQCYPVELLESISAYVAKMLTIFGFKFKSSEGLSPLFLPKNLPSSTPEDASLISNQVSQRVYQAAGVASSFDATRDENPLIDLFAEFRGAVRHVSLQQGITETLDLCDTFRRDVHDKLGIRLEDKFGSVAGWKFVDKVKE